MNENSIKDLKNYFGENKPVATTEMMEFWKSLTDAEKVYFKNAQLS